MWSFYTKGFILYITAQNKSSLKLGINQKKREKKMKAAHLISPHLPKKNVFKKPEK